jgi:SAM-dependent methyltransferase
MGWKQAAAAARKILYRHTLTPVDRWTRPDQLLPPAHLRLEYYRTLRPEAYARACEAARTELMIRGLQPAHHVLDIGCGIGNLAVGLAGFLEGRYEGTDVNREAVAWCRDAITSRHPNFHFQHADVVSVAYNRNGRIDPADYRYPFEDRSFDRIFLGSVLTHLLPDAVDRTMTEIARLLRPGGICVASCFLLNDDNRASVEAGRSFMSFGVALDRGRVHSASCPEAAVALDEAFVRGLVERVGLRIGDVRRGGWWSGASDDQDVLAIQW